MSLLVPVSVGEALDKYNILQLKYAHASQEDIRRHVTQEMQELEPVIRPFLHSCQALYDQLNVFNQIIWTLCDRIRQQSSPADCVAIIRYNDARYRVKRSINDKVASKLREEKIYTAQGIHVVWEDSTPWTEEKGQQFILACRCFDTITLSLPPSIASVAEPWLCQQQGNYLVSNLTWNHSNTTTIQDHVSIDAFCQTLTIGV